jgi:zinc transport system ATP-binding protein
MQMMNTEINALEVRDICFSYGNDEVLTEISFNVPQGDYLGIIGPNGAGKTTLLKIILGLLRPSEGTVKFYGEDIRRFKGWSRIGYVPQKATNFDANFPATVNEVVLMGRYASIGLLRSVDDEDREIAAAALKQVGMWDYRERLIGDLSGGQQQRVFIARALAGEPELMFLDEPTTGIDRQSNEDFYALLKELNEKQGITLVLISHDIDMVSREVKHIACVDKTLVCHDLPKEFMRHAHVGDAFPGDVKILSHKHDNHAV